jgi:tRNA (mo5U34)-methyltransferase
LKRQLPAVQRASQRYTVRIETDIAIASPSELPPGIAGKDYFQKLVARGGKPPYFWCAIEGALPRGLSLDANSGSILGLPENPGRSAFRLQVTDRDGDIDEADLTLDINALEPDARYSAVVSQVAAGGGWRTAIHILNPSPSLVSIDVNFYSDDGSPMILPLTLNPTDGPGTHVAASLSKTIPPYASLVIATAADITAVGAGWAEMVASSEVAGYCVLHYKLSDGTPAEETVPLELTGQRSVSLLYDNTCGARSAAAVVNLTAAATSVDVTAWDENWSQVAREDLAMPPRGHASFLLSLRLPNTEGHRGVVQFRATGEGRIAGLSLLVSSRGRHTATPRLSMADLPNSWSHGLIVREGLPCDRGWGGMPGRQYGERFRSGHSTQRQLPASAQEVIDRRYEFEQRLVDAKKEPLASRATWYPYDSLSSIDHFAPFLREHFHDFERAFRSGPVIDVGCGDGAISLFFESLGCEVTATDYPPNNHNWMKGVRELRERFSSRMKIFEVNMDYATQLPGGPYGLATFLGVLYHLKNPYLALETLARQCRYCVVSTRVADFTKSYLFIKNEPLAYLLDRRETNNDASNQFVFSHAGMQRIAKRAGWRIIDQLTIGCGEFSNPIDLDKDARMFLFMRSERLSAPATLKLLDGWTNLSEYGWAWTLKEFSFEVTLLNFERPPKFQLQFTIPDVVAAASPLVTLSCAIEGQLVATKTYTGRNEQLFEADLPSDVDFTRPVRFEFAVDHSFTSPDGRDLGIIVSFDGEVGGISENIHFWLH